MHIASTFSRPCPNRELRAGQCGSRPAPLSSGVAEMAGGLMAFASMLGRTDRLASQWQTLAQPLTAAEPSLPTTEMSKGQSLQSGRTSVNVDSQGNLTATTAGASAPPRSQPQPQPSLVESFLSGFMEMASALGMGDSGRECREGREGREGCQAGPSSPGGGNSGPAGLRIEGGHIILPNGKKVPFGNTGAIIEMPDGTRVGVGRNSETDSQHVRWVTAGPGQEIPTNPPGKTNLFKLDAEGNLAPAGVQ